MIQTTPLSHSQLPPTVQGRLTRWLRRESVVVTALLAVAALLRLVLAHQGWPALDSDESTLGLMTDDILWHHALPIFLYGQNYLGALQAYLAAPIFLLFGPNDFALYVTTTLQTLLFLLVLYLFTREVYSRAVAVVTLALLALGPAQALFFELHAASHAQDTLFFGTLLLWLVVLRFKPPTRKAARLTLDAAIGLVIGLGVWGTFVIFPFVIAAGIALVARLVQRARRRMRRQLWGLLGQVLLCLLACGIALAPLIWANIVSEGATISQSFSVANVLEASQADPHPGLGNHLILLVQQLWATLLVGLPWTLGSTILCGYCVLAAPTGYVGATGETIPADLVAAGFSLVAILLWMGAASPLARDLWRSFRRRREEAPAKPALDGASRYDARWWGRWMLVVAAALTLLQYAVSSAAFYSADTALRYLVGLYACTPLAVDLLWRHSQKVRDWVRNVLQARRAVQRPGWRASLAGALLVGLLLLNVAGAVGTLATSTNRQAYGVPAGGRDVQLMAFLRTHQITRVYTSYWVCNRLMFETAEQVICAVISNEDTFMIGHNRIVETLAVVEAAPHPAYLFDTTAREISPGVRQQVAVRVASGDPQFAGYRAATVADYLVYYYSG